MKQVLRLFCFVVICFGIWVIFPEGAQNQMERPIASEVIQQRVMEVFEQNQKTLRANPDVLGIIPSPGTGR